MMNLSNISSMPASPNNNGAESPKVCNIFIVIRFSGEGILPIEALLIVKVTSGDDQPDERLFWTMNKFRK